MITITLAGLCGVPIWIEKNANHNALRVCGARILLISMMLDTLCFTYYRDRLSGARIAINLMKGLMQRGCVAYLCGLEEKSSQFTPTGIVKLEQSCGVLI